MEDYFNEIDEFDFEEIKPGSCILLLGANEALSRLVMKRICYSFEKKIPFVKVFSPGEKSERFYSDFVPENFICSDVLTTNESKGSMTEFEKWYTFYSKYQKTMNADMSTKERQKFGSLLILDDCGERLGKDVKNHYGNHVNIIDAIMNRDALNLTIIIKGFESIKSIPYVARLSFDVAVLLTSSLQNDQLYKTYANFVEKRTEFIKSLNYYVGKGMPLVIQPKRATPDRDRLYSFTEKVTRISKPLVVPHFRLCRDNVWKDSQKRLEIAKNAPSVSKLPTTTLPSNFDNQSDITNMLRFYASNNSDKYRIVRIKDP